MRPPPNTCPQIDNLSIHFDAISGDLETFRDQYLEFHDEPEKAEVEEIVAQTIAGLQSLRVELEALRRANEQLRQCGAFWYKKASELS